MVIDPRRDCDIYIELATIESVDITYILETHRNEDYVIGSLELQNLIPSVRIGHSAATNFKYGDDRLQDDETLRVGKLVVRSIHTPGHTDDSMCFVVSDSEVGSDPLLVFTGDTLFVNEVGRTDLVDPKKHSEMSYKLWHSLHEKVLPLGDGVIIYPGHGSGSVCGGAIGSREFSTIGYEKRNNYWLRMDEESFVEHKTRQELTLSSYFKRCEKLNTDGPPLIADLDPLQMLNTEAFAERIESEDSVVIDTRLAHKFVSEHIPDSISMDIDNMGLYVGWVLSPDDSHLLVLDSPMDLDEAVGMLYRVGIDCVVGYLNGGFEAWKSTGKPVGSVPVYDIQSVQIGLNDGSIRLVDVRQPHETIGDRIENSTNLPLSDMLMEIDDLDPDLPIATICPAGVRSTTAASILQREGFEQAGISEIGLKEWKLQGLPTSSK